MDYLEVVLGFIIGTMFYYMVLKPMIRRVKADWKLQKRVNLLMKAGLNIETPIKDPNLTQEELELMNSSEEPREEDIWKYYQMYCKKFKMDTEGNDIWTTLQPMPFEDWEKKAKKPTHIHGHTEGHELDCKCESCEKGRELKFTFRIAGGYLFLIASTCDAMVGFPPNEYYMRWHDYAKMVEVDNDEYLETLENENV